MSAMNGELQTEINVLTKAIAAVGKLRTTYRNVVRARPAYSRRIENCENSLNAKKNDLLKNIGDQQEARARKVKVTGLAKAIHDELLPALENELSAVQNILNTLPRRRVANNNRNTVAINIRSNFDSVINAIQQINTLDSDFDLPLFEDAIRSLCSTQEQQILLRLFETLPACDKNEKFFKFELTEEHHPEHEGGDMFALFLREKVDWEPLNILSMTEVQLESTPDSTSVELRWIVPPNTFTEFKAQYRVKPNQRNVTFTSSPSIPAAENSYTIRGLQSDTDYEIILLCQLVQCNLFVPSFHIDVRTLPPPSSSPADGSFSDYLPSQEMVYFIGALATLAIVSREGILLMINRFSGK